MCLLAVLPTMHPIFLAAALVAVLLTSFCTSTVAVSTPIITYEARPTGDRSIIPSNLPVSRDAEHAIHAGQTTSEFYGGPIVYERSTLR